MAWTANTIVKYQSDATANVANAVAHVTKVDTAGPNKVIFHYDAAVDPNLVLSNISSLYILPEHVWGKYVGSNGKDLKTFRPENNLPLVSGGPFQITKYSKKGTTVFKPNPGYWGAPPHVEAVGLVYYTNSDSMIADLQGGTIDAVDQVPYTAVNAVKKTGGLDVTPYKYGEFTNITWNSNPRKPKNRELLDPQVKKALSMCVDRQQIISVIYAGQRDARQPERDRPVRHRLAEPGRPEAAVQLRRGQRHARSARLQEGRQRHPRRAGHHRQVRAACAPDAVPDHGAEQPRLQRQPRVLDRAGRLRRRPG